MAPNTKRWIDKKSAETYQLRYRSQADPLIHDSTAPDFVFTPVAAPNTKVKNAAQLSTELAAAGAAPPRSNEGEAAMYGIYYDDSAYDYMQHLREPGAAEAVLIDAKAPKPKPKTDLAAALAATPDDEHEPKRLIPKELMASEVQLQRTWRDQQDVQDEIRGFRPDMDPRLREVLEALEDEAYVDDDEDIFGQLAEGGEATPDEFYDGEDFWDEEEEEDGGWESDATEKPGEHQKAKETGEGAAATAEKKPEAEETGKKAEEGAAAAPAAAAPAAANDNAWMSEFSKFKKAEKRNKKMAGGDDTSSMADTMSFGGASSLGGTMSISGRTRRRHKKAGTESSGYSMTSSSLFRTEGLTTLDARFDKIEEEYAEDSEEEDDTPAAAVPETRQDFNSIMDEFLEGYNVVGRSNPRVRKGKALTGLEQLDEIRQGLGKARISERPPKRAARVR